MVGYFITYCPTPNQPFNFRSRSSRIVRLFYVRSFASQRLKDVSKATNKVIVIVQTLTIWTFEKTIVRPSETS